MMGVHLKRILISIACFSAISLSSLAQEEARRLDFYGGPNGDVEILVEEEGLPGATNINKLNVELHGRLAMELYFSLDVEPQEDFCTGGQMKVQENGLKCTEAEMTPEGSLPDPDNYTCALGYLVATAEMRAGLIPC